MMDSKQHGGLVSGSTTDDVVSTPEGDLEYPPGEPIGPADGLQVPSGNAPIPYDTDVHGGTGSDGTAKVHDGDPHREDHEKGAIEKTFDKLGLGQILT